MTVARGGDGLTAEGLEEVLIGDRSAIPKLGLDEGQHARQTRVMIHAGWMKHDADGGTTREQVRQAPLQRDPEILVEVSRPEDETRHPMGAPAREVADGEVRAGDA